MQESPSRVDLIRVEESVDGSFGVVLLDGRAFCVSLEPEDNGNAIGTSNIPHGVYRCERVVSPRFGETFQVTDVPGRSHILFHAGNTEDDTAGCILLARKFGVLGGKRGVLSSGVTFREFLSRFEGVRAFDLHISEAVPRTGTQGEA